jgi:hypothetical protein|tara:strand:+ start:1091 stop:1348 length:258 start_codon:yes stop_codon:yes gene_type:complete
MSFKKRERSSENSRKKQTAKDFIKDVNFEKSGKSWPKKMNVEMDEETHSALQELAKRNARSMVKQLQIEVKKALKRRRNNVEMTS